MLSIIEKIRSMIPVCRPIALLEVVVSMGLALTDIGVSKPTKETHVFVPIGGIIIPIKKGCKDPMATNYDPKARKEDGSCQYDLPSLPSPPPSPPPSPGYTAAQCVEMGNANIPNLDYIYDHNQFPDTQILVYKAAFKTITGIYAAIPDPNGNASVPNGIGGMLGNSEVIVTTTNFVDLMKNIDCSQARCTQKNICRWLQIDTVQTPEQKEANCANADDSIVNSTLDPLTYSIFRLQSDIMTFISTVNTPQCFSDYVNSTSNGGLQICTTGDCDWRSTACLAEESEKLTYANQARDSITEYLRCIALTN